MVALNGLTTRRIAADILWEEANAVFDGASAVMLSDESAFGEYPVRSLCTLTKVAYRAEEYMTEQSRRIPLV
jgi:pyruvate kinase